MHTRAYEAWSIRKGIWLQHAPAALGRAVWASYGWDDPVPAGVDEDTILSRLLALNGERAGSAFPTR